MPAVVASADANRRDKLGRLRAAVDLVHSRGGGQRFAWASPRHLLPGHDDSRPIPKNPGYNPAENPVEEARRRCDRIWERSFRVAQVLYVLTGLTLIVGGMWRVPTGPEWVLALLFLVVVIGVFVLVFMFVVSAMAAFLLCAVNPWYWLAYGEWLHAKDPPRSTVSDDAEDDHGPGDSRATTASVEQRIQHWQGLEPMQFRDELLALLAARGWTVSPLASEGGSLYSCQFSQGERAIMSFLWLSTDPLPVATAREIHGKAMDRGAHELLCVTFANGSAEAEAFLEQEAAALALNLRRLAHFEAGWLAF